MGEYGLVRKGPEVPEVLMRIPMIWAGPQIAASSNPHPAHVSLVDVMPTLCEAIGVPLPDGTQGRSLWPLLTGGAYPEAEFESVYAEQGFGGLHYEPGDEIVALEEDGLNPEVSFDCLNSRSQSGTMRMLRKGRWKLAIDMQGRGQLYDLESDPGRAGQPVRKADHAEVERELLAESAGLDVTCPGSLPLPRRRYVIKRDQRNYWSPYR